MKNRLPFKVCFLAGTLGQGGAEQQLFYVLGALKRLGAVPRVLCLGQNEFWTERIAALGVAVVPVGQATSKLARLFRIIAELRRDRPQMFQSQHFYTNAYVGAAARLRGLIGIGALRSNGLMEVKDCGPVGGWLNLHVPHLIAANSQTSREHAIEQGVPSNRLFLLSNVVDTVRFNSDTDRHSEPVRLISVGRLIPSKRFDRFISLVARLRGTLNREVSGIIVGDGPLKDRLRAEVVLRGLPSSAIELYGSIEDSAPVYRKADVFVMTSEYEGTPNVLLEAMASGLPVVAPKVGGVPEIIRDGQNGFLVKSDDEEGFCAALERLVNDPQLRLSLGRRGRACVEANHSLEQLPAMLNALYAVASGYPKIPATKSALLSQAG